MAPNEEDRSGPEGENPDDFPAPLEPEVIREPLYGFVVPDEINGVPIVDKHRFLCGREPTWPVKLRNTEGRKAVWALALPTKTKEEQKEESKLDSADVIRQLGGQGHGQPQWDGPVSPELPDDGPTDDDLTEKTSEPSTPKPGPIEGYSNHYLANRIEDAQAEIAALRGDVRTLLDRTDPNSKAAISEPLTGPPH